MKRATLILLLLGGLCTGALVTGLVKAKLFQDKACQPSPKRQENRFRKFQKQLSLLERATASTTDSIAL